MHELTPKETELLRRMKAGETVTIGEGEKFVSAGYDWLVWDASPDVDQPGADDVEWGEQDEDEDDEWDDEWGDDEEDDDLPDPDALVFAGIGRVSIDADGTVSMIPAMDTCNICRQWKLKDKQCHNCAPAGMVSCPVVSTTQERAKHVAGERCALCKNTGWVEEL